MTLLPTTTSELERKLESLGDRYNLGEISRSLWNPYECPEELLIYLAWALSVDEWNDEWPETVKRDICAGSLDIHRMKGTTKSMQDAVSLMGHEVLIAYTKDDPDIQRGKFRVRVKAVNQEITTAFYDEMVRVINECKRGTLHLDKFEISSSSKVKPMVVAFTKISESFLILPLSNMEVNSSLNHPLGALTVITEVVKTTPIQDYSLSVN